MGSEARGFVAAFVRCMRGGSVLLFTVVAASAEMAATPEAEVAPPAAASPPAPDTGVSADACAAEQSCVDGFLWSLYERTPKLDTAQTSQQTTATVRKKGKTVTVTKTVSRLVDEDFTWKDPKAAELAGMTLQDYVIGGMDPGFRVTLFRALRVLDDAGFKPGIMCAFRDDYRQSIATGLKARDDRSYHGGSFRGGYGHGMAADIVSVRGADRTERSDSTGKMWEWIDAHEMTLGIGRPYRDHDPPHVGPLDGQEYADHRLSPDARPAKSSRHGDDKVKDKDKVKKAESKGAHHAAHGAHEPAKRAAAASETASKPASDPVTGRPAAGQASIKRASQPATKRTGNQPAKPQRTRAI